MPGTLYLVATPIGNLDDMPPRVAATFGAADFIAAEDTRVTLRLLNHLGLKKPMVSYYEHALHHGEAILQRIEAGENCALCSDAGMPCISDPGEQIVKEAHARGIKVGAGGFGLRDSPRRQRSTHGTVRVRGFSACPEAGAPGTAGLFAEGDPHDDLLRSPPQTAGHTG